MNNVLISTALRNIRPGAFWELNGDSYDGLIWHDKSQTKPTKKEVEDEAQKVLNAFTSTEYQRKREDEYPPLTDLADAIYWQIQGDETKMTAYLEKVEAVKQKYPKE
jgi:hypothetical protein